MNITHVTSERNHCESVRCIQCNVQLPLYATFCSGCGENVDRRHLRLSRGRAAIVGRYRITTLVRRRSRVQLFIAIDNQLQQPVVIRDIDISNLDNDVQAQIINALKHEHELLHGQYFPHVMSVMDLCQSQDHLFTIAQWPFTIRKNEHGQARAPLSTLQDLLQSGIGLPDEQVAVTWIVHLCHALKSLHQQQIILGDLDPHTILVSDRGYHGLPTLMVSWIPLPIRSLLSHISLFAPMTPFNAPEMLLGKIEPCSDIYSLSAILYLLLTGTSPQNPAVCLQRSAHFPRELSPKTHSGIEAVVMQALSPKSSDRFQSAEEMSNVLLQLYTDTKLARPTSTRFGSRQGKYKGKSEAMSISCESQPSEDAQGINRLDDATVSMASLQVSAQDQPLPLSKVSTDDIEEEEALIDVTQKLEHRQNHPTSETQLTSDEVEVTAVDVQPVVPVVESASTNEVVSSQEVEAVETHLTEKLPLQESKTVEPDPQIHPPSQASGTHEEQVPRSLPGQSVPSTQVLSRALVKNVRHTTRTLKEYFSGVRPALPNMLQVKTTLRDLSSQVTGLETSLLKRARRFILGELQRSTTAAALIETPLRIQPDQHYSIRIHLLGRDELKKDAQGLSALVQGEVVHIEVRSAIRPYAAYVVQKADVLLPKQGYAAEVMIPMLPLSARPGTRYERLHIFFMDEKERPLYEKPFVIEIFISHLVQAGREGYNVLSIPL